MIPRGIFPLFLLLALVPATGLAADDLSIAMTNPAAGSYFVEGSFAIQVSSRQVWGVVTDYDRLPDFVSSMQSSVVRKRDKDSLLLEQKFKSRFLFFRRSAQVLLRVQETPCQRIAFEDVSKKDFDLYQGSWEIQETPRGILLVYRLHAEGKFHTPAFVIRKAFKKGAQTLLQQVRSEILRRNDQSSK